MNTGQIENVLKNNMPDCFVGVFSSDKLPKIKEFPSAFVANTDPSHKSGTHWVAFYLPSQNSIEYFDTYGKSPKVPAFQKFVKGSNWKHNSKQIQGPLSSVCGQYCIYYLMKRNKGLELEDIISQFSENLYENDELIKCYVNDSFDLDTEQYDFEFLGQQICKALCQYASLPQV